MPPAFVVGGPFFIYHFGMSRWQYYNPNPYGKYTIDCAVRAVSAALDVDWRTAYALIHAHGYGEGDMGPSNDTWGAVLRRHGFRRAIIPNSCPVCYTAEDFATDNPVGTFVLGFENHTAAVIDGRVFDSFDSTQLCPQYYWYREE